MLACRRPGCGAVHLFKMLLEQGPGGADLGAQVTDEHRGLGVVSRPHVDAVVLLGTELCLAIFLGTLANFIRSRAAVHAMYVLLVPVGAVFALELLPAHGAAEHVARVSPLMLLESDLRFKCLVAVFTTDHLAAMDPHVISEVTRCFELLAAL